MTIKLRSDFQIFLFGSQITHIQGSKLPSNGQVLILYFSTIREPLILLLGKVRR